MLTRRFPASKLTLVAPMLVSADRVLSIAGNEKLVLALIIASENTKSLPLLWQSMIGISFVPPPIPSTVTLRLAGIAMPLLEHSFRYVCPPTMCTIAGLVVFATTSRATSTALRQHKDLLWRKSRSAAQKKASQTNKFVMMLWMKITNKVKPCCVLVCYQLELISLHIHSIQHTQHTHIKTHTAIPTHNTHTAYSAYTSCAAYTGATILCLFGSLLIFIFH